MKTFLFKISCRLRLICTSKSVVLAAICLICSGEYLFAAIKPAAAGRNPASYDRKRYAVIPEIKRRSVNITLPSVSYPTPPIFYVGTPATLTPTSSGVASPAYSSTRTTLGGSAFNRPRGITSDASGNIYIADFASDAVYKIPAGGVTPVAIGTGFNEPFGVAVDPSGNVYVSDYGNNAIKKILAGTNTTIIVSNAITNPCGIALDAYNNIYVADDAKNTIDKIPAGGGAPFTFASGFTSPLAVAVDNDGNVFVGNTGVGPIKEILANGDPEVSTWIGFQVACSHGIVPDNSGNVFVADALNGTMP